MSLLGFTARTYRNLSDYSTPNWSNMGGIRDNTLSGDKDLHDGTTRDSGKFKEWLTGHIDAGIEMTYRPKPIGVPDPHRAALLDSWLNSTPMELWVLDEEIIVVGAEGLRAFCEVSNFNRSEPIDGVKEFSFTIKPSANNQGHPPAWVIVT